MPEPPPYPLSNGAPVPMSLYLSDRERDQRDREAARRDQDRQFDRLRDDVGEVKGMVKDVAKQLTNGFSAVNARVDSLEGQRDEQSGKRELGKLLLQVLPILIALATAIAAILTSRGGVG